MKGHSTARPSTAEVETQSTPPSVVPGRHARLCSTQVPYCNTECWSDAGCRETSCSLRFPTVLRVACSDRLTASIVSLRRHCRQRYDACSFTVLIVESYAVGSTCSEERVIDVVCTKWIRCVWGPMFWHQQASPRRGVKDPGLVPDSTHRRFDTNITRQRTGKVPPSCSLLFPLSLT